MNKVSLVKSDLLLSVQECKSILELVFLNRNMFIKKSQQYRFLGLPLDYAYSYSKYDETLVFKHNAFMKSELSFLLFKVTEYFEKLLGKKVISHKSLSLPGFNIFDIKAKSSQSTFFHFDYHNIEILKICPELSINKNTPMLSFTVLLSDLCHAHTGLSYFEKNNPVGKKIMGYSQSDQGYFVPFSSIHLYKQGYINIHQDILHSVYTKNENQEDIVRVTLQGHVFNTEEGALIFW